MKGQRRYNYKYSAKIDARFIVNEVLESKAKPKQEVASVYHKKRPSLSDSVITWEASTLCITESSDWR